MPPLEPQLQPQAQWTQEQPAPAFPSAKTAKPAKKVRGLLGNRFWRPAAEQTFVFRCLHPRMFGIQSLALAVVLLAAPACGQDWRPVQMLPMRYPCWALTVRMQGRVQLRFTIDDRGTPRDVSIVTGHPLLAPDAAAHLKSLTVRLSGSKARSLARMAIYIFRLDPKQKSTTDLVPTRFNAPNIVIVTSGYVQPSSPCKGLQE